MTTTIDRVIEMHATLRELHAALIDWQTHRGVDYPAPVEAARERATKFFDDEEEAR